MRRAAHRDKSEKPIVAALRAVGAYVLLLSGKGVPDLLVCFRGTWTPLEVKTPKADLQKKAARVLTPAQREVMALAPYAVVETPEQALREIGATAPASGSGFVPKPGGLTLAEMAQRDAT